MLKGEGIIRKKIYIYVQKKDILYPFVFLSHKLLKMFFPLAIFQQWMLISFPDLSRTCHRFQMTPFPLLLA